MHDRERGQDLVIELDQELVPFRVMGQVLVPEVEERHVPSVEFLLEQFQGSLPTPFRVHVLVREVDHLIVYQLGDSDTSLGEELNSFATFHFSLNLSGPILPLNLDNLKQAYPENHQFHDLLDANFSGGQAIFSFDEFHNTYKVNRILGECSNH